MVCPWWVRYLGVNARLHGIEFTTEYGTALASSCGIGGPVFWILFFQLAYGSVPTAPIAEYELGSSETQYVDVYDNHALSVDGTQVSVVSIDSWDVSSFAPCSVASATVIGSNSELPELWVGCDTGDVVIYLWDGLEWVGDGTPVIDAGDGALRGLIYDGDGTVFGLLEPADDGFLQVVLVDLIQLELNGTLATVFAGYLDHSVGVNRFVVAHEDYRMSAVNMVGTLGNYTTTVSAMDARDVAPDTVDGAYILDEDGSIWQFDPDVSLGAQLFPVWTERNDIRAIGTYTSSTDAWFMTSNDAEVTIYDINSGVLDANEELASFAYERELIQIQTHEHGYHFGVRRTVP